MPQNEIISYEMYSEDIGRYRTNFEQTILEIYQIISPHVNVKKMDARIKSYESFVHNLYCNECDGKKKKKEKNLNDCFGIKIMLDDDKSIKRVLSLLKESGFVVRGIKDHKNNPDTNYNAVHVVAELKNQGIPFEIQLRTEERAKGRLPHDIYKRFGAKKNYTDTERRVILKEFIELARLKINGDYGVFSTKLPLCYRIKKGQNQCEKPELVKLTNSEIVQNLYPTVEDILGEQLFSNILKKLFPKGIQERRNLYSDEDKKILEIFFDYILESTVTRHDFSSGPIPTDIE